MAILLKLSIDSSTVEASLIDLFAIASCRICAQESLEINPVFLHALCKVLAAFCKNSRYPFEDQKILGNASVKAHGLPFA